MMALALSASHTTILPSLPQALRPPSLSISSATRTLLQRAGYALAVNLLVCLARAYNVLLLACCLSACLLLGCSCLQKSSLRLSNPRTSLSPCVLPRLGLGLGLVRGRAVPWSGRMLRFLLLARRLKGRRHLRSMGEACREG
jgi:hypothetical protein